MLLLFAWTQEKHFSWLLGHFHEHLFTQDHSCKITKLSVSCMKSLSWCWQSHYSTGLAEFKEQLIEDAQRLLCYRCYVTGDEGRKSGLVVVPGQNLKSLKRLWAEQQANQRMRAGQIKTRQHRGLPWTKSSREQWTKKPEPTAVLSDICWIRKKKKKKTGNFFSSLNLEHWLKSRRCWKCKAIGWFSPILKRSSAKLTWASSECF